MSTDVIFAVLITLIGVASILRHQHNFEREIRFQHLKHALIAAIEAHKLAHKFTHQYDKFLTFAITAHTLTRVYMALDRSGFTSDQYKSLTVLQEEFSALLDKTNEKLGNGLGD